MRRTSVRVFESSLYDSFYHLYRRWFYRKNLKVTSKDATILIQLPVEVAMKFLFILFTLCGQPQAIGVSDGTEYRQFHFKDRNKVYTPKQWTVILTNPDLLQYHVKIETMSNQLCV